MTEQISNENLSPEVRSHLAEIIRGLLTGTVKFPKRRPPTTHSSKKTWKIALRVFELRRTGWDKVGAAVKKASEEFDCSETKVWGCLKQLRDFLREQERFEHLYPRDDWYDEMLEKRREERQQEEEREEEERRDEEWREQLNEAEAYLIESQGERDYTDKEIEDAAALLERQRAHYK